MPNNPQNPKSYFLHSTKRLKVAFSSFPKKPKYHLKFMGYFKLTGDIQPTTPDHVYSPIISLNVFHIKSLN